MDMEDNDRLGVKTQDKLLDNSSTSCDLMCEDDSDDFVHVETPSDVHIGSEDIPSLPSGDRPRRFLRHIRRQTSPHDRHEKSWAMHEISGERVEQIESLASDVELSKLSESHRISHHQAGSTVGSASVEEEHEGITAGIGLTVGAVDSVDPGEPGLSSDMLMSIAMGEGTGGTGTDYSRFSVRHSVHIGLAPADLRLEPADEEMAKEASRSRIDSVELDHREFEDEDVDSQKWCQHSKHIFILSLSGKPVYSRYGKEDKLVNLFGIMQALVSFVQDDKDNLRFIVSGNHQIVFMCRGPLVLVAVSQTCQSVSQLAIQLGYAYNQVLSVLTNTQLQQIFEKSPGFDLRHLLQGSEKFVDNILNMTDTDPSLIFAGVRCLSMPPSLRQGITNIITQHRSKDVLFAVLVANNQVITFIRPKEHSLLPLDIHLILNLVDASTSFRSAESWTPICLPKFNDTGFLHAHVSYLPNDSPACLLLFSTDKEKFFSLQECQQRIVEKLEKQGYLESIKQAVIESGYDVDHLQAPELRHFIYKSRKTSSMTSPQIPNMYADVEDQKRLFELYMFMQQKIHSQAWPTKILYHVAHKEAMLGWRTSGFDLYAVFDPLIAKSQAILLGNKLIRWISREEERLIITSSYTF